MAKKGRSSSYVELMNYRKNASNHLTVGINLAQLEMFLCESIPLFSDDDDLTELAKERYHGIAARHGSDASSWTADELDEVVTVLQHFLNSAPSLPARLVFFVHSQLGCIRLLQQKYDNAIQSFLKALWILTSTNEPSTEQIALCLHRLGLSYGRYGKYGDAVNLLNKALEKYESTTSLSRDHPCIIAARDDLAHFREMLRRSRKWSSLPPRHFSGLPTRIDEDLPVLHRRVSH